MAAEVGKCIREVLKRIPANHPDRKFLEGQAQVFESFTIRPLVDSRVLRSAEAPLEIQRFTDEAREGLRNDGALVYEMREETISAQVDLQRQKGKPAFYNVVYAGERLTALPSRLSEVAVYPDPERFFVPNTGDKSLAQQEKLVAEDAEELRKKLGDIDEVIPDEAATLTGLAFQHFDKTGEWLFSEKYARALDCKLVYGRTKNPTNRNGSYVAVVGGFRPGRGFHVGEWHRDDGHDRVHAVRLVVPRGNR